MIQKKIQKHNNKKGSTVILTVVILPVIIIIIFNIVFSNMKKNIVSKKIQTQVDNTLYYGVQEYGLSLDWGGEKICAFEDNEITSKKTEESGNHVDTFYNQVQKILEKTDGYNELWFFEVNVEENKYDDNNKHDENKNDKNEYLLIKVYAILPKDIVMNRKNKGDTVWGTSINQSLRTGWYAENSEVCIIDIITVF